MKKYEFEVCGCTSYGDNRNKSRNWGPSVIAADSFEAAMLEARIMAQENAESEYNGFAEEPAVDIVYKKIITHGGRFHADEVLAIALLRQTGIIVPIERSFTVSEEDLADLDVLVLDIGRCYDPDLGQFDHHQDATSDATNILILNFLMRKGIISDDVAKYLLPFFKSVSDIDRGVISDGGSVGHFNSLIGSLNVLEEGFDRALAIAKDLLNAQIKLALRAVKDERRWTKLQLLGKNIKIQTDLDFIANWKEFAKKDEVVLLITPNPRGGWQIISRDTQVLIIPEDSRQNFVHANGFIAGYDSIEDAKMHAQEIVS